MKHWTPKQIGYTGISFPFRLSPSGTVTTSTAAPIAGKVQHVVEAVTQIIRTAKGERFFNRSFGSNPVTVVFEKNSPQEMMLIASEIKDIFDEYEPRVTITQFDFVDSNPDEGWIQMRIKLSFIKSQVEQLVEVILT